MHILELKVRVFEPNAGLNFVFLTKLDDINENYTKDICSVPVEFLARSVNSLIWEKTLDCQVFECHSFFTEIYITILG